MSKTWEQIESDFQSKLAAIYPQEEIQQLFHITLEDLVHINKHQYIDFRDKELTADQLIQFQDILVQLASGRPIQHITGQAFFYKSFFRVSEHTLIPRPETEELVHMIIQDLKNKKNKHIIDIGTGSGCIPISIASQLPQHNYWALDISNEALKIAQYNAVKHKIAIQFINADILEWEYLFQEDILFDVIVSNPPYITPKEKKEMHSNVLNFEPHLALFIEEDAPLLFYDYISSFAQKHLRKGGFLYFEINQYLGSETVTLLQKKGFANVQLFKDINGADRMIRAKWL